jgi:hypothetical protein
MDRQLMVLVALGLGLCLALAASAAGWLGGISMCGAERALGCISWPLPISHVVWAAFIVGVAARLVWQVRYLDR